MLLFSPDEEEGAGDEVGDNEDAGPPTAPRTDPPGEWLLAAPFPTALPLPDAPPFVELLDADTVLEPMFKLPAVLFLPSERQTFKSSTR